MKVLIADDEEHVREGIELSVNWEAFGVTERLMAEDGQQALELIEQHNPAVLFCDMSMPVMDGRELLHLLREQGRDTQVIIISGYNDFSYTRAAILADGVDYILKPFRKRDLEQALERAIAARRKKEHQWMKELDTGYRIRRADAYMDEHNLAGYFNGNTAYSEGVRCLFEKVGLPLEGLKAAVILPLNRGEIVKRRYYDEGELFVFAVNNIAQETLDPYGSHYLCRLDDYQWLLLTAAKAVNRSSFSHPHYVHKLMNNWRNTLGLEALVGLCDEEVNAETLNSAIGEARAVLLNCGLLDTSKNELHWRKLPRLTDSEILLQSAFKNKNKAYAQEIIRVFMNKVREYGKLRLKDLQAYTIEANLLLERTSRLLYSDRETADAFMPLWISDLDEWENMLIRKLSDLMGESDSTTNGGIEMIHDYVTRHFHEDMSLSSLSETFHFTPQYIAKKYKELYNTTVMTYLTELRIEKAKSLLIHTVMPVTEIANSLGYTDDNYFGKVFKKLTGLTPIQFRKQQRDS